MITRERIVLDRSRPGLRVVSVVLLAAGPFGCVGPFDTDDFMTFEPTNEQIYDIKQVDFADQSQTAPMTVEEGAEHVLHDILATPPPSETLDLSLAEVRVAALSNNLDLRVELMSPSISETSVTEAESKFEWAFTADFRRRRTDAPAELATESSKATFTSYEAGVRIPLRTGGTATVNFPLTKSETNNVFSLLNPAYTADLQFSISQPLLRNAGNKTNTHSIRVAKYSHQITNARTKLQTINILAGADNAYWLMYAAARELEVRQQQYELAMAQLERARRRHVAGDVPEIEITRAESGVAQRLEAIIIAEALVRRTQRNMKRIMNRPNLPMRSKTRLVIATEPDPLGLELDPSMLVKTALDNRMELLELEIQLALDNSAIDFERNGLLPDLTVDYTYNPTGLGSTYNNALDQMVDRSFENWSVGISAEIPIGNEAAQSRYRRAILQRLQHLATQDQREQTIAQEVYDALDRMEQDWQRILAARQDTVLAARTYEGEKRQFDVGARTSTDVLDAATRLADAQSSEIRALADYEIAQVNLAVATGTLLGYGQVTWHAIDEDEAKMLVGDNEEPTAE